MSKILLINKDKDISNTIIDIIEKMEYIPLVSKDLHSAFRIVKEDIPGCIILDISFFNTGEIDIFSYLKSNKKLKSIPVILTVGKDIDDEIILSALQAGADDYIKIPINPMEMRTRINIMIKLKMSIDKVAVEREFISTILDNTKLFIVVTDFNFNILRFNNYVAKFFYSADNILNKNLLDLAFPENDYLKNIRETLKMFIESDSKVFYPEIILTKHNKTEHTYKWTISKEYSPDNKEVLIFVGQDMSDTRRYETMIESLLADSKLKNIQLEEANAQLEIKNSELSELNTLKTEYISIASHDLRTPISQIMGLSQLLIRDRKNPPSEKQQKLIGKILESAEFQLSLVSDILDITKVETGHMKLELELTDINSLIKRSVKSLEELTQSKGIQVNVHELKEHRLVKIDSLKILQVINNLIGNAVKFTYEGGKIDVSVKIENEWLVITVKDTGVGIKKEELEKIFDKFGKNRKKGTMGEKGTGLGLSICKKLIELHKGEIGVKSEYGVGSTFYFKTPVR